MPNLWIESLVWRAGRVELVGYTRDVTSLSRYLNYLNELSEESALQTIRAHDESGFSVFQLEVKGLAAMIQLSAIKEKISWALVVSILFFTLRLL